MQIRASLKLVKLGYVLSLLLALAIAGYLLSTHNQNQRMWATLIVPAIFLFFVMVRHARRTLNTLIVSDGRLRYESGLLSKTTRSVELAKLQDIRVDQTLGQRMLNIGDLSFETAGGGSRIVIVSIDRPQQAADQILALSRAHSVAGTGLDASGASAVPPSRP
jgi:uncharacterized membrane protein YdbT with pleckstrin-like domain